MLVLQPLLSKPFQDATTDKNRNGHRWTRQGERLILQPNLITDISRA